LDFLHGYVYARWPYFYIGVGTGEHRFARLIAPLASRLWGDQNVSRKPASDPRGKRGESAGKSVFAETYHGKVVPLSGAKELVTINTDVTGTFSEKVIPYARAREIVLKNPDHIVALDCPCRASRQNPCLPLDVCLIVGEPFAAFMLEHHPERTRSITQAEAVEILKAEDARGHVHHAFFKDAMLGRFYAICNCCSCCCGAMQAHRNGNPMLASSGYVSSVDDSACIGCGKCAPFCQFHALDVREGRNHVDTSACMGCGICVNRCEQNAVRLVRDHSRGEPLSIRDLMAAALPTGN
jgi:Pyruvate/2-oxoacid:ferredoxin oxidoreductase delta subunit